MLALDNSKRWLFRCFKCVHSWKQILWCNFTLTAGWICLSRSVDVSPAAPHLPVVQLNFAALSRERFQSRRSGGAAFEKRFCSSSELWHLNKTGSSTYRELEFCALRTARWLACLYFIFVLWFKSLLTVSSVSNLKLSVIQRREWGSKEILLLPWMELVSCWLPLRM